MPRHIPAVKRPQPWLQFGWCWHNDGSFCREVFGHVVYHIVNLRNHDSTSASRTPQAAAVQKRLRRMRRSTRMAAPSTRSSAQHPLSGRTSLYLHLGMTGAMLEVRRAATRAAMRASLVTSTGSGRGSGMARQRRRRRHSGGNANTWSIYTTRWRLPP